MKRLPRRFATCNDNREVHTSNLKKINLYLITLFLVNYSCSKKEVVLDAILVDDLSNIELKLYNKNHFETKVNTWASSQTFEGNYQLKNDTIFFLDPPYGNKFIPRKVLIKKDKIILKYDKEGKIDTSYASFFQIKKSNIQLK